MCCAIVYGIPRSLIPISFPSESCITLRFLSKSLLFFAMESNTKEISARELEDAACHASELHEVVMAAADRLDDNHLYLAARSLQELNEELSELAYQ